MDNIYSKRYLNYMLTVFAILNTAITIYFVYKIRQDQSASLGYMFLFFGLWILQGVVITILFILKLQIRSKIDYIVLFFCTPLPILLFFFTWSNLPSSESPTSTYEHNKNGHRFKEVTYQYSNGQTKRVEFYFSQDTVSESSPFPENEIWIKDSIWIYYNKDGSIIKKEQY